MPDRKVVETHAEPRRRGRAFAPRDDYPRPRDTDNTIDLLPYLLVLKEEWRVIAAAMGGAIVLALILASLILRKSYQATAILRPTPRFAAQGRLEGSAMPESLGAFAGLVGRAGDEAEEYKTILGSFVFTTSLIRRHHIVVESGGSFLKYLPLSGGAGDDPAWRDYRDIKSRFSSDYSAKTGNITLYYLDRSVAAAQRVLEYYIDDLRDLLRQREVQDASAAMESLKGEARTTSDYLLQAQLYGLAAKQMQQLKLAQVQADFAFRVLEPPIAPPKPYSPSIPLDCAVAAVLGTLIASVWVLTTREPRELSETQEGTFPPHDDVIGASKNL